MAVFTPNFLACPQLHRPTLIELQQSSQFAAEPGSLIALRPEKIERDDSPESALELKILRLAANGEANMAAEIYFQRISRLGKTPLGYQHAMCVLEKTDLAELVAQLVDRPFSAVAIPIDFPGMITVDRSGKRYVPSVHVASWGNKLRWTSLSSRRAWALVAVVA